MRDDLPGRRPPRRDLSWARLPRPRLRRPRRSRPHPPRRVASVVRPAVGAAREAAAAGGLRVGRPVSARDTALTAMKSALAAALAWEAARRVTGEGTPVFAPLTALLAVQVTVRRSVGEVLPRLLALVAGVAVAVGVAELVQLSTLAVVVIVAVSVAAGGVLRLPPGPASQVPVTGLLLVVLGGGGVRAAELRVVDGVVGLLVGLAVNALVVPPLGLAEARVQVRRAATSLAELLADLAVGLPGRPGPGPARRWLSRARALDEVVHRAGAAVAGAAEAHRWNPRARGGDEQVRRLGEAVQALEHVALQVRGVCRSVADEVMAAGRAGPDAAVVLPDGYRHACAALSEAVQAFADLVQDDGTLDSVDGLRLVEAGLAAAAAREALARDVLAQGAGPEALLLHGSLLADLRRAALEVDPLRGEHRDAVRRATGADPPAPGRSPPG